MAALLDIDHLRTLIAITDAGSFTRAGDVVHKTQSAISMQMKRLEERIGRPIFERDGRGLRLTADGERLVVYARRLVRLNVEALSSFAQNELAGRVRLGVPDDYADRYLPEILVRFAESNPRVEVSVVCEPTPMLVARLGTSDLDLAIITYTDSHGAAQVIRREPLFWVTSTRHAVHEDDPVPLALGQPTCCWRQAALMALEGVGRRSRILYTSWNSTAVGAAVSAGLAVTVLPESAVRPGLRLLRAADGFPTLPSCKIALLRNQIEPTPLAEALSGHITASLDNLSSHGEDERLRA